MSDHAEAIQVFMARVGINEPKPEQQQVICSFLEPHDVFATMPTGNEILTVLQCYHIYVTIYRRRKSQLL